MDIVSITKSAQIVQRLLAHMHEDANAIRQNCIVNINALVHSMPNVQQMLLHFL